MKISVTIDTHVWTALKKELTKQRPEMEYSDYEYVIDQMDSYVNEILCNHLQGNSDGK